MIGEVIAGYRIEASIGAELHGQGFRARNPGSGESVAIKIFSPEAAETPGGLDGLFNELRASSLIRQPGLVRILDCDNPPGRPAYLIREDLRGESLRDCLNRVGNFSRDLEAIRNIVIQTCQALSPAHSMGLFHHCLSPETIFLTTAIGQVPPFQIKLTEFGMGRFFHRQLKATMSGMQIPVALLRYCSPEQCRGADSDQRADIYSLGCILYELLTGRLPFVEATMADMFLAHVTKHPPTLLRLAPGIPPGLAELVETMLEKEPNQRPFCTEEITAAINSILGVPRTSGGKTDVVDERTTMFIDPAALPTSVLSAIARPLPASTPIPPTLAVPIQSAGPQPSLANPPRFPSGGSRPQSGERQILRTPPAPAAPAAKVVGPGLPEVGGTQVLLAVQASASEGPNLALRRKQTSNSPRSKPSRDNRRTPGDLDDTFDDTPSGVFNQRRNLIVIALILLAGIALTVFLVMRSKSPSAPPPPKSPTVEKEVSLPAKVQPNLKIQALSPAAEEPLVAPAPSPPKVNAEPPAPKKRVERVEDPGPARPRPW